MALEKKRRNGKEASCEPCRKAKVRCDHDQPVCGRCRQRSLQSQCYYHPAPMAKIKEPEGGSAIDTRPWTGGNSTLTSSIRRFDFLTPTTTPGGNQMLSTSPDDTTGADLGMLSRARLHNSETSHKERLSMVIEVLKHLKHFSRIRKIVEEYFAISQASVVPSGLIIPALDTLSKFIERYNLHDTNMSSNKRLKDIAEEILCSRSEPINITASLLPQEFVAMYTVPQFRLEYFGIIIAIGSRVHLSGRFENDKERDDFVRSSYRCCTICLSLSRELTPVNDATLWLSLETLLLCSNIHGDLSERLWHLLGDLSSDIYSMGINREAIITSNTPFFLTECRRKTFAKSYYLDVSLSSLFNRPQRILRRYSDCKLPLNLADEELTADPIHLEQARSRLSSDGWNTEGKCFPTSSIRLRCLAAEIREETTEYEFRSMTRENTAELEQVRTSFNKTCASLTKVCRKLALRNQQIRHNLPPHLKYTSEMWDSSQSGFTTMMLAITYLGFLQNEFQIYRLIEKGDPQAAVSLIETASEILAIVLGLSPVRRKVGLKEVNDLAYIIVIFGLPSAVVLATAAQNLARQGLNSFPLPPEISPSSFIRTLSVFVFQLQNTCGPGEANYDVCIEASKTISRTSNEIIDGLYNPTPASAAVPIQSSAMDDDNVAMLDFEAHPDILDGFDLSSWAQCIDWTGTGVEWSTF